MAAPITIIDWFEVPSAIYTNVHSLQESADSSNFHQRLQTWKDEYFTVLNPEDPKNALGLIWTVPTIWQIDQLSPNTTNPQIDPMDPIINLVQNTIWAVAFSPLTPEQEDGIVDAFNNAWT